ncbi:MAG: aminotransferase class IV [bacterium]|nr:aminotransferase class IV [bacterium]
MPGERFLYLNGEIIEESQARISPFDRGFLWGDGVYEITPCFGRKLYRLEDHIDRLYRSLRYVRIDPGISPEEMKQATLATLETNLCRTEEEGMYRVGHWVTRGVDDPSMAARESAGATVLIFWRPVDVERFAKNYREGVKLAVTATRRNPPECVETRAKVTSKMNQILAELDAAASGALSLMLDIHGNVAENSVANIFIVRDGVLWTPPERNILEGVTRKAVFELAERLGIPLEERNFTMYDVAQAEEYFLTSSAICAMPVRSVDSFHPKKEVPGPVTRKLIEAFVKETGYDFRQTPARTGQAAKA